MSSISLVSWAASEQNEMRKGIVMKFSEESLFMNTLRFVPVTGITYPYAEMSTLGGIAFRSVNGTYDPSAGIVNPKVEQLAIFGGIVQLDHTMQGSAVHTNAVMAKVRAAGLHYDYNCINGNPQADANSFTGLKLRITGNQLVYAGTNGGALTLAMLDDILDRVAGPNEKKVLLMSKYQRRALKAALVAAAAGATLADVSSVPSSYDGARIVVMDEDAVETAVLPQTETRGSSNVTGSIYCIRPGEDPEGEMVQGLVRSNMVEYKPLAQTNTQINDLVEMFGGLGVFHGRAASRLAGLT